MTDHDDPIDPPTSGEDDPILAAAGKRLRDGSSPISPTAVEVAVLRRRTRRIGAVAAVSIAVVALLGGLLLVQRDPDQGREVVSSRPGAPKAGEVDRLLALLDDQPVDPTKVRLLSAVSTFADCNGLIGDLRKVGAEHVGSRGFGGFGYGFGEQFGAVARQSTSAAEDSGAATSYNPDSAALDGGSAGPGDGETLGTNVQVEGVDELDFVKAEGERIYDLDGKGNLRITDAATLQVLSTIDVTPTDNGGNEGDGSGIQGDQVSELLVASGRVAIFGSEYEVSKPVDGDPSAAQGSTSYLTVTFVDATDPASPETTDRVRIEGSLVSARLVDGQIRLVTTSNMADLGFVMPTTPNSVAKALDQNRRTVASSIAPDWIPDWQRAGSEPEALVPCERVHVPDTFSGVAMTSMVTFSLGSGRFEPAGTSILAPATTLYVGVDKVAISSEVWVDPIDRDRLQFDDWQTAIHEFSFTDATAPGYEGSGIVDGSTVGQFAFGEVGGSLAVVTTKGTPWQQDPGSAIDLTILTPDGDGGLDETSTVADLADGKGAVAAVRFVEGRILISTGPFGNQIRVVDVSDPADPRRAGSVDLPGLAGYFHPLPDQQALVIGSRSDTVGEGKDKQSRSWVQAHLLDVSDPDAPRIISTWERPWVSDEVGRDHHNFTYWPDRNLAMWGLRDTRYLGGEGPSNEAAVLSTDGAVTPAAIPVVSKPNAVPSPCPTVDVTDPKVADLIGPNDQVLRCADPATKEVEWPRYQCYRVDDRTVAQLAPGEKGAYFVCSPASPPAVSRVLVVSGRPILFTDQTLEALDPTTFASTAIAYHPTGGVDGYEY